MCTDAGWAFRDRRGLPRPLERDDIRRVVANWAEYGSVVPQQKAKDRAAYEMLNVDEVPLREDRAVFPLELLRNVGQVRQERSRLPTNHGVNHPSHPYALTGITYCYHCETLAQANANPKLRTRLGGKGAGIPYEKQRYRHKQGMKCGAHNRSVLCEIYERDFLRLVNLLAIKPEKISLMTELAIQASETRGSQTDTRTLEEQRVEAIALCKRRIDAVVHLYADGRIDRAEYLRRVEAEERDIAHWEARTTETKKRATEFAMCMDLIDKITRLWEAGSDEDRQGLSRSLFEYVVYDLDRQRIVDFRLKSWADDFLILRGELYGVEEADKQITHTL
jgi:hypothetical protein